MSTLVVQLPARARLRSEAAGGALPGAEAPWSFAYSEDGSQLSRHGQALPGQWPKADLIVAVVPAADVSWHRLRLPKAPPAKLRAALGGMLEEALLEEESHLHFALAAPARPDEGTWVAALHKPSLSAALALMESRGFAPERLVPSLAPALPGAQARAHFSASRSDDGSAGAADAAVELWLAGSDGLVGWPLAGSAARAAFEAASAAATPPGNASAPATALRRSASPGAAAAAERWLGAPVEVLSDGQVLWEAAASPFNLLQFDLAPRHRGWQALRSLGKRLRSHESRPLRWGLAALVGVNLIGLNAWAWTLERQVSQAKAAQEQIVREAFPQLRTVYQPALQMAAETDRLRAAAGRPGAADFESLLNAAASAWPAEAGPTPTLRFVPGQLSLNAGALSPQALVQFQASLRPMGLQARTADGVVTVQAAAASTAPGAAR